MEDLEILANLKKCYEYLEDILGNADKTQVNKDNRSSIVDAIYCIENTYEEIFEAKCTENNIRIPNKENLIIAETPTFDYYDIENNKFVTSGDIEYEWWNDSEFYRK